MSCQDPQCHNFNKTSALYCDKCIQAEIEKMSYEEVAEMYMEGKEWIDSISFNEEDTIASDLVTKFKEGWFALLNVVLLSKDKENIQ